MTKKEIYNYKSKPMYKHVDRDSIFLIKGIPTRKSIITTPLEVHSVEYFYDENVDKIITHIADHIKELSLKHFGNSLPIGIINIPDKVIGPNLKTLYMDYFHDGMFVPDTVDTLIIKNYSPDKSDFPHVKNLYLYESETCNISIDREHYIYNFHGFEGIKKSLNKNKYHLGNEKCKNILGFTIHVIKRTPKITPDIQSKNEIKSNIDVITRSQKDIKLNLVLQQSKLEYYELKRILIQRKIDDLKNELETFSLSE